MAPADTDTAAPQEQIAGLDLPENLGEIVQSQREIIGEITVDEAVRGDYGPQWHFAFRPLTYTLETKTGAHHEYVPMDKRGARTKFGIIVASLFQALGEHKPKSIGKGELIGRQLVFLEKDFTFGKDRETGEPITRTWFLFMRNLNDDDKAQIASAGGVAQNMPTSSFSDEQVREILNVIDGVEEAKVSAAAARSKDLSQELKASVLSGTAIPALVKMEKIAIQDGVIRALPF